MSDTATETAVDQPETAPETPAVEVDADGIPVSLNNVGREIYKELKPQIEECNSLSNQIAIASGNVSSMKEALTNSFGEDDYNTPEHKKIAADIEKLDAAKLALETKRAEAIDAHIKSLQENSATEVGPLVEKRDSLKKAIRMASGYLTEKYGEDATYGLPKIVGTKSASTGTNAGAGQPRYRNLEVYVDGELATLADAKGEKRSHLAAGGKAAMVSTTQLRDLFHQAQGTTDPSKFKDEVSFDVTGSDNKTRHVKIVKAPVTE